MIRIPKKIEKQNLYGNINTRIRENFKIILIAMMLLGAFLRLKGTLMGNFAFTYDSARDMIAVKNIIQNHDFNLIGPTTGLPGLFYGPWWYWFLVIPYILSSGDPMVAVVSISVVCIFMIPLAFWLGKQVGDYVSATATALIVALSPVFIASSVQLWSPNFVPFFTLLALIFYWRLLHNDTRKDFLFLGFTLGGAYHSEVAYGLFFNFSITLSLCVIFLLKKKFESLYKFTILIAGFLFTLIPQIIFELRHGFLQSKALIDNFIHPKVFQKSAPFFERMLERLGLFFSQFIKMFAMENFFIGILCVLLFGYLIIKILKTHNIDTKTQFILGIILTLFTMFLGFSLFPDAVWEYYLVGIPVLYLGIFTVISGTTTHVFKHAIVLIVVCCFFAADPLSLGRSFSGTPIEDQSMIRNQKTVIDKIYTNADGNPFSVEVYTPTLIDYPYTYLFDWYGNKTYHYGPTPNQKVVYYILEKDASLFRRHWIGEHSGDGKIIFEETLNTGVIIQKRMRDI